MNAQSRIDGTCLPRLQLSLPQITVPCYSHPPCSQANKAHLQSHKPARHCEKNRQAFEYKLNEQASRLALRLTRSWPLLATPITNKLRAEPCSKAQVQHLNDCIRSCVSWKLALTTMKASLDIQTQRSQLCCMHDHLIPHHVGVGRSR
jgi:hypothetical protein